MQKSLRTCLSFFTAVVFICSLSSACHTSAVETNVSAEKNNSADVIYQAFNTPFQEVKQQLPELQKLGYTYIQVSPPQKSNPSAEWWARYQPIDHTIIDSPLGKEKDLKALINEAHKRKIKIIIDVVLNHMANYGNYAKTLQYSRFSRQDFYPKSCIDYNNRFSVTHSWINCDLPDLKTESSYVRQEAKNYLQKLLKLEADGFRFDATKHIEPDYFREVLKVVPSNKFVYGEVIGSTIQESNEYTGIFSVTDFQLVGTMLNAFSLGGDLRSLIDPASSGKALPGIKAVTFANNHDIDTGQIGYQFSSHQDTLLANAFILARQEGFPMIYSKDAKEAITKAGVIFHQKMMGLPQYFRNGNEIASGADNPNMLFIERGNQGLAIINKAGDFFDVTAARMPGLQTGCYKELRYNFTVAVNKGNDGQKYITRWGTKQRGGIQIGARDVLFLVSTSSSECQ